MNKHKTPILLEVMYKKYGKIEFVDYSLLNKNKLIEPIYQKFSSNNSLIICGISSDHTKDTNIEHFYFNYEIKGLSRIFKGIPLIFIKKDENLVFDHVSEILYFGKELKLFELIGMWEVKYKGKCQSYSDFVQNLRKDPKKIASFRSKIKKELLLLLPDIN